MVTTRLLTADDLFRLGPDAPYELFEGELVKVNPPGGIHGAVLTELTLQVGSFVKLNKLGKVFAGDTGFVIHEDPDTVLGPDLAFVRQDRLAKSPAAYIHLAPDLAVEVISPSNIRASVERKVTLYLEAGVDQVWVVDPVRHQLSVHQAERPISVYGYAGIVPGGDTLPGFEMRVDDLFE